MIKELTLNQIIKIVNGSLENNNLKNINIKSISTDTREDMQDKLYIALVGENFDGHDFIDLAIKKGAAAVISHKKLKINNFDNIIWVKNTKQALIDIASYYRTLFDIKIIGVTGSVGKTTTKDMIASVLSQKYNILKTHENLNNEIGVSKTILSLKPEHQVAVIEMGMSNFKEISVLSNIIKPDIGVITNIGVSHIEYLGSQENILKAKLEILDGMKQNNMLILNNDDRLLSKYQNPDYNIKYISIDNHIATSNVVAQNINYNLNNIEFDTVNLDHSDSNAKIKLPCLGKHNIYSALIAYIIGCEFNIEIDKIVRGIELYKPSGMRQKIVNFKDTTIIEDCYNASPDSMKAAIETLSRVTTTGRKILVISDMLELGNHAEQYHYSIGKLISNSNIDKLYCIGNLAKQYFKGAIDNGMSLNKAYIFENKQDLAYNLKKYINPGDMIWFKASRGMKLEEILEIIYSDENI